MTKVQGGCVQLEIACDSMPWGLKFEVPSENGNKRNRIPLSLLVLVVFLEMVMYRPIYILRDD